MVPVQGACARRADAPAPHRTSGTVIRDLAARLRALPPSCGPVRLIGVDGHAGSGKTTFAGRLAAALGDAPVLHLDDIATHEELFGWTRRLLGQVVEPLSRGETARYVPYDWSARAFGPVRELPPAPVILLEGSAPAAGRCARISRGCCGWNWRATRPGHEGCDGTARRRARSGPGGSPPSVSTSSRILKTLRRSSGAAVF